MNKEDTIKEVKTRLCILDNYHDELLESYIKDIKEFMVSSGISLDVIESEIALSCIARGVSDLWLNDKFSEYFYQRITQLRYKDHVN